MTRDTVDLDDVLGEEREELAQRRNQAGFRNLKRTEPDQLYQPADIVDPIGLAVSGGGVRSAAFSLGVLQSFYQRGLLRFCDYLSTVSGGSYVGGFLTSLAVHGHTDLRWTGRESAAASHNGASNGAASAVPSCNGSPTGVASPPPAGPSPGSSPSPASVAQVRQRADALAERITIEPDAQQRQPHYVRRLILGSSYLDRPLLFFSHWLPGFLQNNLIALGGLLFICALGAWLFRTLDTENWMRLLLALGFSDDISRAFFPTVVVFLLWAIVLGYRAVGSFLGNRSGRSSVAPSLTLLLLVMAMVSTVSLIGVGDVNATLFLNRLNIPLNAEVIAWMQTIAQWVLYTVLAAAVIPYLSADALLRSGSAGASWRDRFAFKFMTHAMLWGVPLVVFGILASENISQFNSRRDDHFLLTKQTIKSWPAWLAVLSETTPPPTVAAGAAGEPSAADVGNQRVRDVNTALWDRLGKERFPDDLAALAKMGGDRSKYLTARSALAAPSSGQTAAALIERLARESQHRDEVERHTSFVGRMGSAVAWTFGSRDNNEFEQLLDREWKFQHDRNLAAALVNDQLLRPAFSQIFSPLAEWLRSAPDGKKLESLPEFHGDPAKFLSAYDRALQVEAKVLAESPGYLRDFRETRLLEAVTSYHLAVHPDRSLWSADLYPIREQLRRERYVLQHPVERLSEHNEATEANFEGNLRALEEAHFDLMHAFYGKDQMWSRDDVFARVVVPADQHFRRWLFLGALGVFLVAGLCIDLNSTSLHRFYRDRLASVWLVGSHEKVPLLTELKTSEKGAPYLLVNCALSFLRADCQDREATAPFLFSHRACGSNRLGFAPSTRYEGGKFDLADAMAISGGAITPTATRNLAVQALMWLMNWRLGRWMANPSVRALLDRPVAYRRIWQRPQALHLLLSWLLVPEKDRDFHFVSDGGLHENLGIEPLIERRCRLIIAIDAGADPKEQFEDLVKLLLRLRLNHGVEIEALNENSPLDQRNEAAILARSPLGRLLARDQRGQAAATGSCQSHFVLAKIKYPDRDEPAWLVYIRPGFDGDESEVLRRFRTQYANFPNDSTDDQFYSFARFEAYRLLGEHIGYSVCGQVTPDLARMKSIQELLSAVENHAAAARVSTATTADTQSSAEPVPPPAAGPPPDPQQMQSVVIGTLLSDQPQSTGTNGDQPTAGNKGKAGHSEQPEAADEQAERLLKELETVVAEVRAGKGVQSSALSHLEARFDELKLCGQATEARLLRLIQQLLEAPDDQPAEPTNPPAPNGHAPAVTLPDDQID